MARGHPGSISERLRRVGTTLLAAGLFCSGPTLAQWRPEAPKPVDGWLVIGDFTGSTGVGLTSLLSNWFFEYERGDSLYRDMGDLGVGIGGEIGSVQLNLDWYFRRRVARWQETKPAGSTITADDISYLSNINTSRLRLRADFNYWENLDEWASVGIRTEGGFSVSLARKRQPTVFLDGTESTESLGSMGNEFSQFFVEEDVNLNENDFVYVTVGSLAAVVDGAAAVAGNRFASTEQAAVYWDEYSRPMMLFPDLGIPVRLNAFMGDDPAMAVGDSLTFLTFTGISPLAAGVREYGVQLGYQRYLRLLRETTVVKEPDDELLVRVRDWRGNGYEVTPFKYRPEVRIWILRLGYTFFESVVDRYRERVSDITYRLDLKTEPGMDKFKQLLRRSARVRITPEVVEQEEQEGVEVLYTELDNGRTHNGRMRANFFAWFEYRKRQLGNTRRILTRDAEFREITRGRMKEYKNRITKKREAQVRSVIRVQSDVNWFDPNDPRASQGDERLATTVVTNMSFRFASQEEIRTLVGLVEKILGFDEPQPALEELKLRELDDRTKVAFDLAVSFGPEESKRFAAVSDEDIWRALAALLLGPEHEDAWATPSDRHWWEPGAPAHAGPQPSFRHIGRYYDQVRGYEKPAGNNRFFTAQHTRSQKLYRMAKKAYRKFNQLRQAFGEEEDCLQCLVDGYASELDIYLQQALAVRFGGGVEGGGVGFDFNFLIGDMTKPVGGSNDVLHGFHIDAAEIVPNTETLRDSPPRIRNGQALLNVTGSAPDPPSADAPCWKIRLFSDFLFDEDLRLRMEPRVAKKLQRGQLLETLVLPLGEPHPIEELPEIELARELFDPRTKMSLSSEYAVGRNYSEHLGGETAWAAELDLPQYFYEIGVPVVKNQVALSNDYTALVRVVNSIGLPVTEEQVIRMNLPEEWIEAVPAHCEQLQGDTAPED